MRAAIFVRAEALFAMMTVSLMESEPWKLILEKGRPPDVVREVARRRKINLVVMGTVARTGVSGLVIGNTAERVLDVVKSSVITVKPQRVGQIDVSRC